MNLFSMILANILCTFSSNSRKCESWSDSTSHLTGSHSPQSNSSKWPIVSTQTGLVQGFSMKTFRGRNIYAFEGIPFAQPPIGNLRFRVRNPVPKRHSPGIINKRSTVRLNCIQVDLTQFFMVTGNEDCLYLNIYTPQLRNTSLFPVIFFIYGGAFTLGSKDQYGPAYLLDRDILLVTVNYRLGIFGFLSTGDEASPGNYGLKDQHLGLHWIRDNVRSFGGDPEQITLMGQSAGGVSVHLHMLSQLSRGKFIRAISQSASAFCHWGVVERREAGGLKVANVLRCPTNNSFNMVDCLRSIPARRLASSQNKIFEWLNYPAINFGPTVEKYVNNESFLIQTPETHYAKADLAKVPWIVGFVPDEGNIYNIVMLLVPFAFMYFDKNFDRLAPLTLEYRGRVLNERKISSAIRKFYFGDRAIAYRTLKQHGQMYGDRYLIAGIHRGMIEHSHVAPTYGYFFNYTGQFGILEQNGLTREEAGISHFDDMRYLFNSSLHKSISLGHPDAAMSGFMVDLWTNFVIKGQPLLHTNTKGEERRVWEPIDPQNPEILAITNHPQIIPFPDSNLKRIRFWDKLHISDLKR